MQSWSKLYVAYGNRLYVVQESMEEDASEYRSGLRGLYFKTKGVMLSRTETKLFSMNFFYRLIASNLESYQLVKCILLLLHRFRFSVDVTGLNQCL